ncbi:MAG: efflux RND transporter periplasmic adaptor subunit [Planctomycetota bacterium]
MVLMALRPYVVWLPLSCALMALAVPLAPAQETALSAFTAPSQEIELASAHGGVIAKVFFEEGARVVKGEPIVALKSDLERADLEIGRARLLVVEAQIKAAGASLEQARKEYERLKDLVDKGGSVSESDVDKAFLQMRLAELQQENVEDQKRVYELQVERAQVLLDEMTVCAPFDGEILLIEKHEGEAVEEHAPLGKFVNVDTLDVVMFAPLDTRGAIAVGATACFSAEGLPDLRVPCTVFLVDSVADAASGTYRVKARIDNRARTVPAGVRGTIVFLTADTSPKP